MKKLNNANNPQKLKFFRVKITSVEEMEDKRKKSLSFDSLCDFWNPESLSASEDSFFSRTKEEMDNSSPFSFHHCYDNEPKMELKHMLLWPVIEIGYHEFGIPRSILFSAFAGDGATAYKIVECRHKDCPFKNRCRYAHGKDQLDFFTMVRKLFWPHLMATKKPSSPRLTMKEHMKARFEP